MRAAMRASCRGVGSFCFAPGKFLFVSGLLRLSAFCETGPKSGPITVQTPPIERQHSSIWKLLLKREAVTLSPLWTQTVKLKRPPRHEKSIEKAARGCVGLRSRGDPAIATRRPARCPSLTAFLGRAGAGRAKPEGRSRKGEARGPQPESQRRMAGPEVRRCPDGRAGRM